MRGGLLMALSNKFGSLLLTTGNKSELATGYCTLYGDMCGGLAVISDVPKTLVYQLARAVNAGAARVIPRVDLDQAALGRAAPRPDRPGQPAALRPAGRHPGGAPGGGPGPRRAGGARASPPSVVDDVVRLVRLSEYKRRQAAPGLKITGKAFGPGAATRSPTLSGAESVESAVAVFQDK